MHTIQTVKTYDLTNEPFLIEELRMKMHLPSTDPYQKLLDEFKAKSEAIWMEFYSTDATVYQSGKAKILNGTTYGHASQYMDFTFKCVRLRLTRQRVHL